MPDIKSAGWQPADRMQAGKTASVEERQNRVLIWLQLTLIILFSLTILVISIFSGIKSSRSVSYLLLITCLLILLGFSYQYSKKGRYELAARLTIIAAMVGPWGSFYLDPAILQGDYMPLVYVSLVVLLSSILLSVLTTVVITVIQLCVLFVFMQTQSSLADINWSSLLLFVLFASLLSIISNYLNRQNIDELDNVNTSLSLSEKRFRSIAQTATDAIVIIDRSGTIIFVNEAAEEMFAYKKDEFIGRSIYMIMPGKFASRFFETLGNNSDGDQPDIVNKTIEVTGFKSDGTSFPVELSLARWASENEVFFTTILRDISERKRSEERLKYISMHDILTGLYNRTYFEEELQRLERGRVFPIGIIMTDVDGLKSVNDRQGHSAGDALLKKASNVLKCCFRKEDVAARIGGDEFAVILPGIDEPGLREIMNRLRQRIAESNETDREPFLSISIGSSIAKNGDSLNEKLKDADIVMYEEKLGGRT